MSHIRLLPLLLLAAPAVAAEPITLVLPERASCPAAVVTIGHIATVSGSAEWKRALGALDIADMPARETNVLVTRRQVEYRLKLVGMKDDDFRVIGAESVVVTAARKAVPVDDVVLAAKAAIMSRLPCPPDEVTLELVQPVAAKMPEIGADEKVAIVAEPNAPTVQMGRQQVNVTISTRGEKRLTLPVFLEAKRYVRPGDINPVLPIMTTPTKTAVPTNPVSPASAVTPAKTDAVLVRQRQKVEMTVFVGSVKVTAFGESQEQGKLGQIIRVRNVDSNKVITGRVTGPGTVEVE